MPPQLEKNHVGPTAWQDEALARDGVSREVPCSALKGETMDCSPPGSSVPGIFQARVLEWVAITFYDKPAAAAKSLQSCPTRCDPIDGSPPQGTREKAMATHSSTLAWKIPGTEEPGRLQSMGSHRVGHLDFRPHFI